MFTTVFNFKWSNCQLQWNYLHKKINNWNFWYYALFNQLVVRATCLNLVHWCDDFSEHGREWLIWEGGLKVLLLTHVTYVFYEPNEHHRWDEIVLLSRFLTVVTARNINDFWQLCQYDKYVFPANTEPTGDRGGGVGLKNV